MKLASAIAKLPIVSVSEGEQIAIVKSLFIDRKSKKVKYLSVVRDVKDIVPGVISFGDIKGMGNDYITVPSKDSIKKTYSDGALVTALEECLAIEDIKVLSSSGDIIGTISDYMVDAKTGSIEKLLLENQREIEGKKLVTLSAKLVVVDVQANDSAETPAAEAAKSALDDGSMAYLVGKTVNTGVSSADGSFTIKQGTVLTQKLIVEAEAHNMLLQLTLAV